MYFDQLNTMPFCTSAELKLQTLPQNQTLLSGGASSGSVAGMCGKDIGFCMGPNTRVAPCCSHANYCGIDEASCGWGCQSQYGNCSRNQLDLNTWCVSGHYCQSRALIYRHLP